MDSKQRRNTRQRTAIKELFSSSSRPLSAEQVLIAVQNALPSTGIATIYRALKDMQAAGEIVAVDVQENSPRYEQAGREHHHHFRCDSCSEVYDLHGCPGHLDSLLPQGFIASKHEIVIVGTCGSCNSKPRQGKPLKNRRKAAKSKR